MGRTVVLGVTGSIAAYKACELVRLMVKEGWTVRVVMTDHAQAFVTPLTFQTLSRQRVSSRFSDASADWMPEHIALAEAADVCVVAPATANILAKMAHGVADDLLSGTLLAMRAPVLAAPAMNVAMWRNAATQENLAVLQRRGVRIVQPGSGELACGTSGDGRMAEPETIFRAVRDILDHVEK